MNGNLRGSRAAGALSVLALLLYWGSLGNPLVFDDGQLAGARFQRFDPASVLRFDLRWISTATFGWVREAFGNEVLWQRFANVLLHAMVASVLFGFLRRLFAVLLPADARAAGWYALFGALLFLAHPAAVYGVAYLIQRSIVMATLFGLLSLWLFLEGLLRNRSAWFIASAAAYLAAVFSKEHAVMLPAVAAALAVLLRDRSRQAWRPLALAFALHAAIAVFVTLKAKGLLGVLYEPFAEAAVRQLAEPVGAAEKRTDAYALSILNQGFLFVRYLATWLAPWPGWMSIDLRPAFPAQLLSWPQAAGFIAWLAWPLIAAALLLRRGPVGLAGFAMLAPWLLALTEFAAVRIQEMFVLYRSYLWMALLPAAIPAVLAGLRRRWAYALLAAAAIALLPPCLDRLGSFSSDLRVWDDAVRKIADPGAPYADRSIRNRGVAYYKLERYAEALRDFDQALALDPGNAKAWLLRGSLHMRAARSAQARADFDRALALEPRNAEVLGRRCVVLLRLQRLDEALADCSRAAELAPEDLDSYISLGMVRALRGATAEAERHYRRALQMAPGASIARYQYGVLLRGLGRMDEAQREFAAACAAGLRTACAPQ